MYKQHDFPKQDHGCSKGGGRIFDALICNKQTERNKIKILLRSERVCAIMSSSSNAELGCIVFDAF